MKISVILFALLMSVSYPQELNKYGNPKIILTVSDPWASVIGSDSPEFVLYSSGIIIYKDSDIKDFCSVKLSKNEISEFVSSLNISGPLMNLPRYISAATYTDQPDNTLTLNFDSTKIINVYGSIRSGSEIRKNIPAAFLEIYDKLINYKNKKAQIWRPEKIEVMVWDYKNSPEKPVKWPESWPDLNDKNTIDRGGIYSIYLDARYFDEFLKLFNGLKLKQAVEINRKKYAVSYRFSFPNLK